MCVYSASSLTESVLLTIEMNAAVGNGDVSDGLLCLGGGFSNYYHSF